jgi:glucose-1-phosphate thymidylyltransferase
VGTNRDKEVIGLIPCGGHATRISPLPCSKEILPVGLHLTSGGKIQLKAVSQHLIEQMHLGGVRKAFFILRKGKWDIPSYYGDGAAFGMDIGYLVARLPYGPAYTLDQAFPFVRGEYVAFGYPDILFGPADAFGQALQRLATTRSELVLGLYKIYNRRDWDMVEADKKGRVHALHRKLGETKLKWGVVFAVWTRAFTDFLHRYLAVPRTSGQQPGAGLPDELTVGDVIQAAIREGLHAQSVVFARHTYLDIGTPEGLRRVAAGWHTEDL